MFKSNKRSSIIIINDSILNNTAGDTYSSFFITNLKSIGYDVSKIILIPSDINIIIQEIATSNREYDMTLIVSNLSKGLVGEALGKLLAKKLEKSDDLQRTLSEKNIPFGEEELLYPTCVNVLAGEKYPLIHIQRLFLIHEKCMDNIYKSILKPYLQKYLEITTFQKMADIYLNGNSSQLEQLKYNTVKFQLTKTTDNSVVIEYKCEDLDYLLEFEDDLRRLVFVSSSKPIFHDRLYFDMNLQLKNAIQVSYILF